MIVGTITAITQTDVKRMLAYSAVAHAGFIHRRHRRRSPDCPGRCSICSRTGSSTVGAFAVVSVVRDATRAKETDMARWAGLGRRYPPVGVAFAVSACIRGHSLTSGFVSKFAVFKAAGRGGPFH